MARDYTADDWCWTWFCDLSDAVCWRGRGRCGHCGNYGRRIAPARAAVPTAGIARPSLRSATPGGSQPTPHPGYERGRVAFVAAVIEHPDAGPILFDTGAMQNAEQDWPAPAWEAFPRNVYNDEHHLDNALAAAGYGLGDIRAVV